jgi:hypothetical protein
MLVACFCVVHTVSKMLLHTVYELDILIAARKLNSVLCCWNCTPTPALLAMFSFFINLQRLLHAHLRVLAYVNNVNYLVTVMCVDIV